ncbi:MAG: hypothetical protein KatS3mg056_2397 [Chloroflexus sp.]|nr:MAG: hypothetical protein KatS3mg056_2397 [Chloroflexus sp.]
MNLPYINADKPHLWKADIAASIDYFNRWFITFAPETFRSTRTTTTEHVRHTLHLTDDLRRLDTYTLRQHPAILPTLRMCTAPPLAVDRLVGLAGVSKNLITFVSRLMLSFNLPGLARNDYRFCLRPNPQAMLPIRTSAARKR